MEALFEFFKRDKYAEMAGIELLEVNPGRAVAKMTITPQHLNGIGTVHGGAIFTLADFVFAVASNSYGTVAVAINANITIVKALSAGTLTAEGREVSLNPRLGSYTINVTDETGDLVAIFQGLAYRKKDKIEDVIKTH